MFLGAWPLSSEQVLRNNVSEKKLLPKNHPFVKLLEKCSISEKSGLIGKLRDHMLRLKSYHSTVGFDNIVYAERALNDLESGNYRSFYLEYVLKDVVDEIGDCVLDSFSREYVLKKGRNSTKKKIKFYEGRK